jgi:acetylornithine aminotransferase
MRKDVDLVEAELKKGVACVIIEPIQGVGGLDQARLNFSSLRKSAEECVVLILMKCNLVLDEGSFCTSISQA